MPTTWDLVQYALTAQLGWLVMQHARRSVASFSSMFALARCASLSVLCHLLAVAAASYLEASSLASLAPPSSTADGGSSSSSSSGEEDESAFPFQISASSVVLLTFAFLVGELFLEAVAWLDGVFTPALKQIRFFYFRWNERKMVLEPEATVVPPGIDLRGKVMNL